MGQRKSSNIVHLLGRYAEFRAERKAITFLAEEGDSCDSWTYAEIDKHARALAVALSESTTAGERAILLCPQGLQFIQAILGCFYAGVVAVPAYPPGNARQTHRIDTIWRDAEAVLIITTASVKERIEKWLAEEGGFPAFKYLCVEDIDPALAERWVIPALEPDSLAFLQYTSGSTSEPKGVMVSHSNLMANLSMIQQQFGMGENDIVGGWLPMFHDMGLVGNLLTSLYVGIHAVLMSPVAFVRKPVRWLALITQYQATIVGAPNFGYGLCVDRISEEQRGNLDLSSLRLAYCGSEPIDYHILDKFSEFFRPTGFNSQAFYPCYGMAEATLLATGGIRGGGSRYFSLDTDALANGFALPASEGNGSGRVFVGCGYSVAGQQTLVVDPETRHPLADGQIGEVWLNGLHIAKGYWRKPELTEAVFKATLADGGAAPYLRTGDLGFLREGQLVITGRIKDVIILRGRNYYPQDIERSVTECHPALQPQAAAAFSVEINGEPKIVAVQEVRRTAMRDLPAEAITSAARQAVFEQQELALHGLVLLKPATLPKTSSGKIRRSACRDAFLDGSLEVLFAWSQAEAKALPDEESLSAPAPALIPNGEIPTNRAIEQWIQQWVADRMQVNRAEIATSKPFADFGLDSLTATELAEQLEKWLGLSIPPTATWDFPTIKALAAHLAAERRISEEPPQSTPDVQEPGTPAINLDALSEAELAALLAAELAN
jgi:acyl-CoA synthetase (AMP-forming)/AMP-acid ligase II/acyl carrier protein